jgi:hypothetical protein
MSDAPDETVKAAERLFWRENGDATATRTSARCFEFRGEAM